MPSITQVPPSILVISNRIDYWEGKLRSSTSVENTTLCIDIISELELIKILVKKGI